MSLDLAQEPKIIARIPSVLMLISSPNDWLCRPLVEKFNGSESRFQRAPEMLTFSQGSNANTENSSPFGMTKSRGPSSG